MNLSSGSPGSDLNLRRDTETFRLSVIWLFFLLFTMCAANAAEPLDAWRAETARLRILVENDAPAARKKGLEMLETLPSGATPEDEVRLLNSISRAEIYMALVPEATATARRALELASRRGDRVGLAEANLNIALNSINEGDVEGMSEATTASVELVEGLERPDLLAEALLRMSMLYMRRGQIEESVTMSMQTLEIAKRSQHPLGLTYAHQGLAISLNLAGHEKDSHNHFVRMREMARAAGSMILEAYAVNGVGQGLIKAGDIAAGEAHIRESIGMFKSVGAPFAVNHATYALADGMRNRGRYADALPLISEVVATYERIPNVIGLWYALVARSDVHREMGNRNAATADAERAYAMSRKIGLAVYQIQSAQQVARLHADKGDFRGAYELSAEAAALIRRSEREKMNARVIDLARKYEMEGKRRQIEELTRRNEIQQAEIRQRELQQRLLWTVLFGSMAILGGTIFFLVRLRRSHSIIRDLNASLEQRVLARTSELRQQTRYLRTLIDALPWWVWLKDTKSRYLAVNQAAAATFGLASGDLVGKSDKDVLPAAAAEAFQADDREVMAARSSKIIEERQVTPNGTIWMETFKAPVVDEDGTVLGTVGFARDISERKAIEAAREAALEDARRLARLRSEFLAQISHELRTPLNGILGYAQLLQNDRNLDERQAAGLYVIRQSGEHLLTLINDILDSAKIESGKLELYLAEVPLGRFLQTIAEMIAVKAEQKGLEFVSDISPALPLAVRADEKRLRQVLLNLLANAIKFTDRGTVAMRVFGVGPERIRFEVRDTGVGMSEEQLHEIFEPFAQTGEVQRRLGGTGLGLTISRQFVRLMGGDIQVQSRAGEGSLFFFELDLPVVAIELENSASNGALAGYEGPRRSILVVDDVAENRALMIDVLGRLGFTLLEAGSGAEALEKAPLLRPDLILMDIVMPGMDGLEAARRLRLIPALSQIPVIAVSASVGEEDRKRTLSTDVHAFLPKPVVLEHLLREIGDALQITWTYELPDPRAVDAGESVDLFDVPPPDEMDVLHRLARLGNMDAILDRANYLVQLDERYQPFVERLSALARNYQSKAILRFVESKMVGQVRT